MSSKSPQKIKPRLGRGLSSLISISEVPVQVEVPSPVEPAPVPEAVPAKAASAVADAPAEPRSPSPAARRLEPEGGPAMLPLKDIVPNPHQPRQTFDDNTLGELAASIRSTGLIQPIIVRQVGGQY